MQQLPTCCALNGQLKLSFTDGITFGEECNVIFLELENKGLGLGTLLWCQSQLGICLSLPGT